MEKTLTLAITFKPEEVGLSYCTCVSHVTDLSRGNIIFHLVTLTLKIELLLKNFNLGCYLVMVAARLLFTLTLKFDLLFVNLEMVLKVML